MSSVSVSVLSPLTTPARNTQYKAFYISKFHVRVRVRPSPSFLPRCSPCISVHYKSYHSMYILCTYILISSLSILCIYIYIQASTCTEQTAARTDYRYIDRDFVEYSTSSTTSLILDIPFPFHIPFIRELWLGLSVSCVYV